LCYILTKVIFVICGILSWSESVHLCGRGVPQIDIPRHISVCPKPWSRLSSDIYLSQAMTEIIIRYLSVPNHDLDYHQISICPKPLSRLSSDIYLSQAMTEIIIRYLSVPSHDLDYHQISICPKPWPRLSSDIYLSQAMT
jgi:hypothetical protein